MSEKEANQLWMWVVGTGLVILLAFGGVVGWAADKVIANDNRYQAEFTSIRSEQTKADAEILEKVLARIDQLNDTNTKAHEQIKELIFKRYIDRK